MINFPPATADGQTFQFNNLTWIWEQSKLRWNIFPNNVQIPIPISFGGTGASTTSGARANLGITGDNISVNFATMFDITSGFNTNQCINPDLLVKGMMLPGYRYLLPTVAFTSVISGAGGSIINAFGGQLNAPATRGYASRICGGNTNQLLAGAGNSGGIDWTKTVLFSGRFRLGGGVSSAPLSAHIFRFTLGPEQNDPYDSDFHPTLNRYGVGIRVISGLGPLQLVTQNGPVSTNNIVDTGIFLATEFGYDFSIISRNGNVFLYFNSVLTASSNQGPTFENAVAGIRITSFSESSLRTAFLYWGGIHLYAE